MFHHWFKHHLLEHSTRSKACPLSQPALQTGSATKQEVWDVQMVWLGRWEQGPCSYRWRQAEAKHDPSSNASWAACLQITYFVPNAKHQGVGITPVMSQLWVPWAPPSQVNAKIIIMKNLCLAHFCSSQAQNPFLKLRACLCLQEMEGSSRHFSLHFSFQP